MSLKALELKLAKVKAIGMEQDFGRMTRESWERGSISVVFESARSYADIKAMMKEMYSWQLVKLLRNCASCYFLQSSLLVSSEPGERSSSPLLDNLLYKFKCLLNTADPDQGEVIIREAQENQDLESLINSASK